MKWLGDPNWQGIGVVVTIMLFLFADASVITKIVLCVVMLVAFLLWKQQTSGAAEKGVQVDASPPKVIDPVDTSRMQDVQISGSSQASPNESVTPTATGNIDSTPKIEEKSSSLSWKDRGLGILGFVIIYGIPGVLLFRSSIQWQHIVGIVLLVLFSIMIIVALLPQSWMSQGNDTPSN